MLVGGMAAAVLLLTSWLAGILKKYMPAFLAYPIGFCIVTPVAVTFGWLLVEVLKSA